MYRSAGVRLCFTGEADLEVDRGIRESRRLAILGRQTSSLPSMGPIFPLPFSICILTFSNLLVGGGEGSNRSSLPCRIS